MSTARGLVWRIPKRPLLIGLLVLAILLTVAYIFRNSVYSVSASSQQSLVVKGLLDAVLGPFIGEGGLPVTLVRKLAHMVEFGALGGELSLLFFLLYRRVRVVEPLSLSLLVALTDETIQVYTDRGPQVTDVWIDFAGAVLGLLAAFLLVMLVGYIRRKKGQKSTKRAGKTPT